MAGKGRIAKIGRKADERPQRELEVPEVAGARVIDVPALPPSLPVEAADAWLVTCQALPNLAEVDLGSVELAVSALHRCRQIDALLNEMGYIQEVQLFEEASPDSELAKKTLKVVPDAVVRLDMIRQRAANQYRYMMSELGASRMARARLKLLDLEQESEFLSIAKKLEDLRKGGRRK